MQILRGNRGDVGFDTLIILIALILLAATTAVLLIYFGANLQNRAIKTGNDAEGGGNSAQVVAVTGTDGSAGSDIEHFEVIIKLEAGSDDLRLNETTILLNTPETMQSLIYNQTAGNTADNAATTSDYTVEWLKEGTNYKEGYLSRGDIIKVRFNYYTSGPSDTTGGLGEEEKVEMRIVPRVGALIPVHFITPSHIGDEREPLNPKDGLI